MDAIRYFIYTVLRHDIDAKYDETIYEKGKGVVKEANDPYNRKGGTVF